MSNDKWDKVRERLEKCRPVCGSGVCGACHGCGVQTALDRVKELEGLLEYCIQQKDALDFVGEPFWRRVRKALSKPKGGE